MHRPRRPEGRFPKSSGFMPETNTSPSVRSCSNTPLALGKSLNASTSIQASNAMVANPIPPRRGPGFSPTNQPACKKLVIHRPDRGDQHEDHGQDEEPDRLAPPPKIKGNHKERKTGQELVGGTKERPQEKPSLAGIFDRPLLSGRRGACHCTSEKNRENGCSVLVPEKGQQSFFIRAQGSSDFLNDDLANGRRYPKLFPQRTRQAPPSRPQPPPWSNRSP